MNFHIKGRVGRIAAIGAILLFSASCITVNEKLGENFIPTDQMWEVYSQEPAPLTNIKMKMADKLSGYSTSRFTFGSVKDDIIGTTIKGAFFTLVPLGDSLDFGSDPQVTEFHFCAVRDTLSTVYDYQQRIIQNVYVYSLKEALDSTVLYTGEFMNKDRRDKYINFEERITEGIPVYDGGDSLSFNFSKEYGMKVIEGMQRFMKLDSPKNDSISWFLKEVPGIYIETDTPASLGGRFNLFKLGYETDSNYGYLTGNYAELKIRSDYGDRKDVDTSFVFLFGPGDFLQNMESIDNIPQYAFNASYHSYDANDILNPEQLSKDGITAGKEIYVEGGSGVKPVIEAKEIRSIIKEQMNEVGILDINEAVINKATIIMPYDVDGNWDELKKFPVILSPTVKLVSEDGEYITYAGLTDSSISSENQGDINRSLNLYSPDISHHVQEIMKVKEDENFEENIAKYDIWFLIMHEEITESSSNSSSSAMDAYYQNLMYNSYYNNMMYDPYGYGYGYGGYGGYGYGGYGGYDNYYNYYMMAAYASSYNNSSSETSSIELDKDRYYRCTLNGPEYSDKIEELPRLKVTFSAPKTAENK